MTNSIDSIANNFADRAARAFDELTDRLNALPREWEKAGVDPDLFVMCATCNGILFEDAMLPGDVACSCDATPKIVH